MNTSDMSPPQGNADFEVLRLRLLDTGDRLQTQFAKLGIHPTLHGAEHLAEEMVCARQEVLRFAQIVRRELGIEPGRD